MKNRVNRELVNRGVVLRLLTLLTTLYTLLPTLAQPVPPTTSYSRWLLTSSNAANARSILGLTSNLTAYGNFYGTFTGGSLGLTNLIGTNLVDGTVNSNKLDAATRALLGGAAGGSATNAIGNTNGTGYGTTTLQKVVATNFTGNGSGLTNVTATLYVATTGNDATAQRGNTNFPFRTILAASLAAQRGDTISITNGVYGVTNRITLPMEGKLVGAGYNATYITNWFVTTNVVHVAFNLTAGSELADLFIADSQKGNTFDTIYAAAVGAYASVGDVSFQNALVRNVWIEGASDGVFIRHSNSCSAVFDNVRVNSDWDCFIVQSEPSPENYGPSAFILNNCDFRTTLKGGWTNRSPYALAIHSKYASAKIFGGRYYATNLYGTTAAISSGGGGTAPNTTVEIYGADLYSTSSNRVAIASAVDDEYCYLYGTTVPHENIAAQDGIVVVPWQNLSANKLTLGGRATLSSGAGVPNYAETNSSIYLRYSDGTLWIRTNGAWCRYDTNFLTAQQLNGFSIPPSITNWGGIPYLNTSNQWALTKTNWGAGRVLKSAASTGLLNGNPTGGGPPYWGAVDLTSGGDTTGLLQVSRLSWGDNFGGNEILKVNAAATDLEAVTIGSGLSYGSGTLSVMSGGFNSTNKIESGATAVGTWTNAAGWKFTGGFEGTNFNTGNWVKYTNGVFSGGTTNSSLAKFSVDYTGTPLAIFTNADVASANSNAWLSPGKLGLTNGSSYAALANGAGSVSGQFQAATLVAASYISPGNANFDLADNVSGGIAGLVGNQSFRVGWSSTANWWNGTVFDTFLSRGSTGTVLVDTNLVAKGTMNATNGYVLYELANIPTNWIPVSSSSNTNKVLVNLANRGSCFVWTNYASSSAGSFIVEKITTSVSTFP